MFKFIDGAESRLTHFLAHVGKAPFHSRKIQFQLKEQNNILLGLYAV